jgi:hypothetical protein
MIRAGSQHKVTMERCGWIAMVAKYTISDVLYKKQIMEMIATNLAPEETAKIKGLLDENMEEDTDEFTEFSPDKLGGGYLDLEWNAITFGPNQDLSECHTLEFTCPKFLVPTFGEILVRIFHKKRNNFPYKQGELLPARCGGQINPEVAIACIQEHSNFTAEWTGLEVYHLSCPNRKYRNTPMTIKDYILHKTGGLRMLPTIDAEESGKCIIMIKKGKYKFKLQQGQRVV